MKDKMMEPLLVKLLDENAKLPVRSSHGAAGYDLTSTDSVVVPASGRALIPTGIAVRIPEGCYGRVASRSGLAYKHGLDVGAGVIDADYRGQISVLLFNLSETDYKVKRGERVAQLVLERISTPAVERVDDLDATVRGSDGFAMSTISRETLLIAFGMTITKLKAVLIKHLTPDLVLAVMFIDQMPMEEVCKVFYEKVCTVYLKEIKSRDETFFVNNLDVKTTGASEAILASLKLAWNTMCGDEKECVWLSMSRLCDASKKLAGGTLPP